jgi:hypothetical protein
LCSKTTWNYTKVQSSSFLDRIQVSFQGDLRHQSLALNLQLQQLLAANDRELHLLQKLAKLLRGGLNEDLNRCLWGNDTTRLRKLYQAIGIKLLLTDLELHLDCRKVPQLKILTTSCTYGHLRKIQNVIIKIHIRSNTQGFQLNRNPLLTARDLKPCRSLLGPSRIGGKLCLHYELALRANTRL